jgi:hypothetical protein
MASNVVVSEVDAFMYVVLSKTEKHVPCGFVLQNAQRHSRGVAHEVLMAEFNRNSM